MTGAVDVAAGDYFALALMKDGTVYGWGRNNYNQLGQGVATSKEAAPVKIKGHRGEGLLGETGAKVTRLAAGKAAAIAIMEDGTAYAWGYNDYGKLSSNGIGTKYPAKMAGVNNAFEDRRAHV